MFWSAFDIYLTGSRGKKKEPDTPETPDTPNQEKEVTIGNELLLNLIFIDFYLFKA